MNTRAELRLGILLIVFAHSCDLLSTYLRTPDLSREIGWSYVLLASHGLGGWATAITIKVVAVIVAVLLFALYVRYRRRFYPPEPGASFHEFLHHTHGVGALRRPDGSWVMPSLLLLSLWGAYTISIGSAAYAYFLAMHNMLATPLLARLAETVAPAAIFMVTAIAFWRSLYDDYRRLGAQR